MWAYIYHRFGQLIEKLRFEKIRNELHELIRAQTEALKAQTFGGLCDEELRDFDRRHERIRELSGELLTGSHAAKAA
jgi:hypothetical protein